MPSIPADLGDEQYVLLTTYRRSGIGVPTPVWVVRDGDALVVGSPDHAGKVKRVRVSAKVTLQACGILGRPRRGSVPVDGRAELLVGRAAEDAIAPLRAKYGVQYRVLRTVGAFGKPGHLAVLRITTP
jgi:PPOX class probable F420-dependent enzyme